MSETVGLRVRGLSVRLGRQDVLRGVDLELRAGELVGLLGRNGSGKSTLIRAVTKIVPSSGEVAILGEPLSNLAAAEVARRIAVVPQALELPAGFTVRDVVMMGRTPYLRLLGSERAEDFAAANRSLEQTELLPFVSRRVEQLSGGEQQRVLLARALAQEAPILLLDEPTAHLDLGRQADMLALVWRLRVERSVAVLAVLHDLTLAAHYCDRLIVLDGGIVVADGAPEDVLNAATIQSAFDAQAIVIRHPLTGRPAVLPGA